MTPWVSFELKTVSNVSSTPTLVLGEPYTCLLDSFMVYNQNDEAINVSVSLSRDPTRGGDIVWASQVQVEACQTRELMSPGSTLYLQSNDLVFASCDFSAGLFNVFASYRKLTETTI